MSTPPVGDQSGVSDIETGIYTVKSYSGGQYEELHEAARSKECGWWVRLLGMEFAKVMELDRSHTHPRPMWSTDRQPTRKQDETMPYDTGGSNAVCLRKRSLPTLFQAVNQANMPQSASKLAEAVHRRLRPLHSGRQHQQWR